MYKEIIDTILKYPIWNPLVAIGTLSLFTLTCYQLNKEAKIRKQKEKQIKAFLLNKIKLFENDFKNSSINTQEESFLNIYIHILSEFNFLYKDFILKNINLININNFKNTIELFGRSITLEKALTLQEMRLQHINDEPNKSTFNSLINASIKELST